MQITLHCKNLTSTEPTGLMGRLGMYRITCLVVLGDYVGGRLGEVERDGALHSAQVVGLRSTAGTAGTAGAAGSSRAINSCAGDEAPCTSGLLNACTQQCQQGMQATRLGFLDVSTTCQHAPPLTQL